MAVARNPTVTTAKLKMMGHGGDVSKSLKQHNIVLPISQHATYCMLSFVMTLYYVIDGRSRTRKMGNVPLILRRKEGRTGV